jgi:hypothetical protein
MPRAISGPILLSMGRFLLVHKHAPEQCSSAWAAWRGHPSRLHGSDVTCSCVHGGHTIWWDVEAPSAEEALALLPGYVARSTSVVPIRRVVTP